MNLQPFREHILFGPSSFCLEETQMFTEAYESRQVKEKSQNSNVFNSLGSSLQHLLDWQNFLKKKEKPLWMSVSFLNALTSASPWKILSFPAFHSILDPQVNK